MGTPTPLEADCVVGLPSWLIESQYELRITNLGWCSHFSI
jgi:hypothetical protein